jgi:ligand-binding sensor domain-containing protein
MKKLILPLFIATLIFTQCKKDDNKTNDKVIFSSALFATNEIAIDKQENIWFATDSGLFRFNKSEWTKYELPVPDQKVNSIDIHNDTMLISTLSGVVEVKIGSNGISLIKEYNKSLTGIISDVVNVSRFDPDNNIWFGTNYGLSMFDGIQCLSNKKIDFRVTTSGANFSCITYRQSINDTADFFFGTLGKYLWHIKYAIETDAITGASVMNNGFSGRLTTDSIFSLCAGHDTSIWIGSNTGLTRNKGKTHYDFGDFEYFLEGERVHSIIETDQHIWAGTENGLFVKDGSVWTNYTTTDKLADNFILALAEDKDGGIWIGTRKGISYFKDGTFTNY